ncbi:complement C1q tumor necrosis factor-related protein 3-like [Littorina saxatilis]
MWVQIRSEHEIRRRSDDPNQVEILVQQQAKALQELTAEVAALKTDLAATKQQQNKAVAFTVRFSASEVQVAPKGVFHFDVVPYNIGNGYSTNSGIFTAPFSGVYVFIVNIMITNDESYIQVAIDKSGTPLAETHADSSNADTWNKGMTHVTVHLTEGEQVWVRQNDGGTGIFGEWWTTFTGFLLHAD